MVKVLISELAGPALNWAIANADGGVMHYEEDGTIKLRGKKFDPASNPIDAWPIIENDLHSLEQTTMLGQNGAYKWQAKINMDEDCTAIEYGPTSLITAMRCKVSSTTMNTWIEIPADLVKYAMIYKEDQDKPRG